MWSPPSVSSASAAAEVLGRRLDLRDRRGRTAYCVSRVGDLLLGERVHVEPRMVRAQEPRGVAIARGRTAPPAGT